MLILKDNPRIVMYGEDIEYLVHENVTEQIFMKRSDLLNQPEDFWKEIVREPKEDGIFFGLNEYHNYSDNDQLCITTAYQSGLSALNSVKGEYILIVRENLENVQ